MIIAFKCLIRGLGMNPNALVNRIINKKVLVFELVQYTPSCIFELPLLFRCLHNWGITLHVQVLWYHRKMRSWLESNVSSDRVFWPKLLFCGNKCFRKIVYTTLLLTSAHTLNDTLTIQTFMYTTVQVVVSIHLLCLHISYFGWKLWWQGLKWVFEMLSLEMEMKKCPSCLELWLKFGKGPQKGRCCQTSLGESSFDK